MRDIIVEAQNLCVGFGEKKLFRKLNFSIEKNTIMGIKGKNGAGKTTLCLALAGIETQAEISGSILYGGKAVRLLSIAERARSVGIIFQSPDSRLFSPVVEDEIAFAPENLCLARGDINSRIEFALELCGISHLRHSRTNTLSGGEKQLVAIASVLSMKPELIIADEIFASLDSGGRIRIFRALQDYAAMGSVLMVSHSKEELSLCGGGVIELEAYED
ncbi:MAG: ABC transporter ATP-binding protein [Clostridia bacterium]|nr:ABC transporter ATP-binding protein [Clostridia bacterium]